MSKVQLNSLSPGANGGQDTQRAFAGVRWDLRRITSWARKCSSPAMRRADVYHSDESLRTTNSALSRRRRLVRSRYRRAAAGNSLAVRRVFIWWHSADHAACPDCRIARDHAISACPMKTRAPLILKIATCSRSIAFPAMIGGKMARAITYGAGLGVDAPGFSLQANIGQSYRLTSKPTLFPDGTGLTDQSV